MVTKIKHPQSIHRVIYYNENKVLEGVATCLHAENFLKDAGQLNLVEKKERFDQLIALNQRVERSTLHVIVNFAEGEQLPREKLLAIAGEYMERIGFGNQPYLVYQHNDTSHRHLHIVSTNIRDDGSRIDMNFIGRDKSEPARKALEEKYGLVKAENVKSQAKERGQLPQKIQYGKTDTKRAITNALEYVLTQYRFRSLPQLNAILRLYNLKAERGQPGSRTYERRGLTYQVLDEKGQGVSVPIKASLIFFKPGLDFLEKKFQEHKEINPADTLRVRMALDVAIRSRPNSLDELIVLLRREKIEASPYINKDGVLYGLSLVDLDRKLVLKASDLGKEYSARKILARIGLGTTLQPIRVSMEKKNNHSRQQSHPSSPRQPDPQQEIRGHDKTENPLEFLFGPEEMGEPMPRELSKDKKKKKRKSPHR